MRQFFLTILLGLVLVCSQIYANNNKTAIAVSTDKEEWATEILPERVIYLIDVTNSMEGYYGSQNIFGKLKAQLDSALLKLAPSYEIGTDTTEVIIVPFTDKTEEQWTGSVYELRSRLDTLTSHKGYTNIIGAWNKGIELLDSLHTNFLFLLTDGQQNKNGTVGELRKLLAQWGDFQHKEAYAFYVMLTHEAYDKKIQDVAASTSNLWAIDSMTVNLRRIQAPRCSKASIYGLDNILLPVRVRGDIPNDLDFGLDYDTLDAYYRLNNIGISTEGIRMNIESLQDFKSLPEEHTLRLKVRALDSKKSERYPFLFFTPEEYDLKIINKTLRRVDVQPTGIQKVALRQAEPFQGILSSRPRLLVKSLEWPPFRWFKPDTVRQDCSYTFLFNDQSVKDSARVAFKVMLKNHEGKEIVIDQIDFCAHEDSSNVTIHLSYNPKNFCEAEALTFVPIEGFYSSSTRIDKINKQDLDFRPSKLDINPYIVSIAQDKAWALWLAWGLSALILLALVILLIVFLVKLFSWNKVNSCSFEELKKRIEIPIENTPKNRQKDSIMSSTENISEPKENLIPKQKTRCVVLIPYLLKQHGIDNETPQHQCEDVLKCMREQKVEKDSRLLRQFYTFQLFALGNKKELWQDIDVNVVIDHTVQESSEFQTPEDINMVKESVKQLSENKDVKVCIVWGKKLSNCIRNEFDDKLSAVKGYKKQEVCTFARSKGNNICFCFISHPSYPLFANSSSEWNKRINTAWKIAEKQTDAN